MPSGAVLVASLLLVVSVVGLPSHSDVRKILSQARDLERGLDDDNHLEEEQPLTKVTSSARACVSSTNQAGVCLKQADQSLLRKTFRLMKIKGDCPSQEACCTGVTRAQITTFNDQIDEQIRVERQRAAEAEAARLQQLFPTNAGYKVWLENAIRALVGNDQVKGRNSEARQAIHEITFAPGHAEFDKDADHRCELYPDEGEDSYAGSDGRSPQPSECDIKGMRYSDLCASDNPVKPIPSSREIYTLWEARHADDPRAKLFCPKSVGTSQQAIYALGNPPAGYVLRYGGEAEVKKMTIEVQNDRGTAIDCYGLHLFSIKTSSGKDVLRIEGENASGVSDKTCWAEVVTAPLPVDQTSREIISEAYDAIRALGAAWSSQDEIKASLERSGYRVTLHTPKFRMNGMNLLNDGICQGNYQVPLSAVASDQMIEGFINKGSQYRNAAEYATSMVRRLVEDFNPDLALDSLNASQLRGMFTIYFYNMYWFTKYDTKSDTKKDAWDHLPKTPVVDIVRALPDELKRMLVQWVSSQAEVEE